MAKASRRKSGRARPHAAQKRASRAAFRDPVAGKSGGERIKPQTPIRENDSEDEAGAYDDGRGEIG